MNENEPASEPDPWELPVEVRRERHGWFGESWPSGVCFDDDGRLLEELRKPFPAGESCFHCGEAFSEEAGDSGQATPFMSSFEVAKIVHWHKECMLVQVVGPLAHYEGRCGCHGGSTETPGMTRRQEALEVWRRLQAGELFGR